jgi:hypothetical protein
MCVYPFLIIVRQKGHRRVDIIIIAVVKINTNSASSFVTFKTTQIIPFSPMTDKLNGKHERNGSRVNIDEFTQYRDGRIYHRSEILNTVHRAMMAGFVSMILTSVST